METDTKRVCIKCHKPDLEDFFTFCPNCSYPIDSNYCTDPNCELNNPDDPTPLLETDCYCNYCGSEGQYFKDGLIKPIEYD